MNLKLFVLTFAISLSSFLAVAQDFSQSELPIVVITTEEDIPDEPKILGTMGIIYGGEGVLNQLTDPYTEYNGNIGIETRGNSTQGFDKKTYSLELRDEANQDLSVNLFGMGGEEDWILHAMVIDKTQLRIPMSFYLSQRMGHYAADWRYVEVILNGEYRGLYILTERIKRDDDRVDIAKLDSDDLAGDSLTGGYILRIDWLYDVDEEEIFYSDHTSQGADLMAFQYYYPKAEQILPEQKAYIKGFMDDFEYAIFDDDYTNTEGFRYTDYIDNTSFVDFLLINEFSKNSDGYKLSSYVHKDRDDNDARLKAGPIWDFDQTYGLSVVCSSHLTEGWTYLQNQDGCEDLESMPLWWQRMMTDTIFQNYVDCRWTTLREGPLHQDSLFNWIDDKVVELTNPINRNFQRWDFIGEQIWIEPEDFPETYEGEIEYLKNWITLRLNWLDANLPGNCDFNVLSTHEKRVLPELAVYPNPSSGDLYFTPNLDSGNIVQIFTSKGQLLYEASTESVGNQLSMHGYPSGFYQVVVSGEAGIWSKKVLIQR